MTDAEWIRRTLQGGCRNEQGVFSWPRRQAWSSIAFCAAFVTGQLVGSTTAATRNSYKVRRDYAVPDDAIRWGQANEILVCDINTYRDGGIRQGPVELVAGTHGATLHGLERTTDEPRAIAVTPVATCLRSHQLVEDAHVPARVGGSDAKSPPGLVRQGRWLW